MNRVGLNGAEIAFDDTGKGDQALLLIHGHPFDRSMWNPQVEAAADHGWRVIVPDLRGYGESLAPPGTVRLDQFAADLAALLDHLGIARAVVGGLSMGGQIAMEYVRQFPGRVEGLLLAATFAGQDSEEGKINRRLTADTIEQEGMRRYASGLLPMMLAAASITALPDVTLRILSMMVNAPPAGAAAALRGRAERPCYKRTLGAFDGPALIVAGDEDPFTSRAQAEELRWHLRGSKLLWMEGVGHLPNLERQAEFNEALVRLLERVSRETWALHASVSG